MLAQKRTRQHSIHSISSCKLLTIQQEIGLQRHLKFLRAFKYSSIVSTSPSPKDELKTLFALETLVRYGDLKKKFYALSAMLIHYERYLVGSLLTKICMEFGVLVLGAFFYSTLLLWPFNLVLVLISKSSCFMFKCITKMFHFVSALFPENLFLSALSPGCFRLWFMFYVYLIL